MKFSLSLILCLTAAILGGCKATSADYRTLNLEGHPTPVAMRTNADISAEQIDILNHRPVAKAIFCSAYDGQQELGDALYSYLQDMDKNADLHDTPTPDISLHIDSANSSFRCFSTEGLEELCMADLNVKGAITKYGRSSSFDINTSGKFKGMNCTAVGKSLTLAGQDFIKAVIEKIEN